MTILFTVTAVITSNSKCNTVSTVPFLQLWIWIPLVHVTAQTTEKDRMVTGLK
jgi:hypothetical protein